MNGERVVELEGGRVSRKDAKGVREGSEERGRARENGDLGKEESNDENADCHLINDSYPSPDRRGYPTAWIGKAVDEPLETRREE